MQLLYSLPHHCPIPFPLTPSYPIVVRPSESDSDLASAYSTALFHTALNPSALDTFARLVLHLVATSAPDELASNLRALVLPVHDFNIKYLSLVPDALAYLDHATTTDADGEDAAMRLPAVPGVEAKLDDSERKRLVQAYRDWTDGLRESRDVPVEDQPANWTVDDETLSSWISDLEVTENRLQCLLALALLALPPPTLPPPKPRKKADPQRHKSTLDPEIQLDFLTDQLVLWRVDKVVLLLAKNSLVDQTPVALSADDPSSAGAGQPVVERDKVHEWWEDTVEPLFAPLLPSAVLQPHRQKLFPAASTTEALSTRVAPAPSPFRKGTADRTLLSLDKSLRRKQHDSRPVSDSPTMKRLLGWPAVTLDHGDLFKVPQLRHKPTSTTFSSTLPEPPLPTSTASLLPPPTTTTSSAADDALLDSLLLPKGGRPPRKQERPRPRATLASSKNLFNRREVNLARRPSAPAGAPKKPPAAAPTKSQSQPTLEGRGTKRKSVSPRKIRPSESTSLFAPTHSSTISKPTFVIPDTPFKPAASLQQRGTFARTQSLPSFAQLGAAFRPGAAASPDPFQAVHLPPPPILPGEEDADGGGDDGLERWRGGTTPINNRPQPQVPKSPPRPWISSTKPVLRSSPPPASKARQVRRLPSPPLAGAEARVDETSDPLKTAHSRKPSSISTLDLPDLDALNAAALELADLASTSSSSLSSSSSSSSGKGVQNALVQGMKDTILAQGRRIEELEASKGEMERLKRLALRVPYLEEEATKLRAERDYHWSVQVASSNQVLDMQTELEVLNAGMEDRNAQVLEANGARDFAEAEARSARTCLRELETDKSVQDLRLANLTAEVSSFSAEKAQLEDQLAATRQELAEALMREKTQAEESGALLAALERLEALRIMQGDDSDTDSVKRFEEVDEAGDHSSEVVTAGHDQEEVSFSAPNNTLDEYDVIDLSLELTRPSEVASSAPFNFKAKLQSLVGTSRSRSQSVSRAHPSSHAVKLFAVKEIEDDLTDLRTLLAHLCDEFTSMDPSKIKRLGRLQVQMDEVMDTMRLTATKLKAVRSFVK